MRLPGALQRAAGLSCCQSVASLATRAVEMSSRMATSRIGERVGDGRQLAIDVVEVLGQDRGRVRLGCQRRRRSSDFLLDGKRSIGQGVLVDSPISTVEFTGGRPASWLVPVAVEADGHEERPRCRLRSCSDQPSQAEA